MKRPPTLRPITLLLLLCILAVIPSGCQGQLCHHAAFCGDKPVTHVHHPPSLRGARLVTPLSQFCLNYFLVAH